MIKTIEDMDYNFYDVIDLDANKKLFVQYADDDTDIYLEYMKDSEGKFILNESGVGIKVETKKGNIKIVRNNL